MCCINSHRYRDTEREHFYWVSISVRWMHSLNWQREIFASAGEGLSIQCYSSGDTIWEPRTHRKDFGDLGTWRACIAILKSCWELVINLNWIKLIRFCWECHESWQEPRTRGLVFQLVVGTIWVQNQSGEPMSQCRYMNRPVPWMEPAECSVVPVDGAQGQQSSKYCDNAF